jgi:hypothetical protein
MPVTRHYRKPMLIRYSRDPDVVFRNRSTFCTEQILDLTVMESCLGVTPEYNGERRKVVNAIDIFHPARGFQGAIVQLANSNDRSKYLLGLCDLSRDGIVVCQQINDCIRVQKIYLPLMGIDLFAGLLNRIAHLLSVL